MTEPIHGHEIINLVFDHPEGIEIEHLTTLVANTYGADARYYTCSAEDLTLQELLSFLADRDKVQLVEGKVFPGGAPACNHD